MSKLKYTKITIEMQDCTGSVLVSRSGKPKELLLLVSRHWLHVSVGTGSILVAIYALFQNLNIHMYQYFDNCEEDEQCGRSNMYTV